MPIQKVDLKQGGGSKDPMDRVLQGLQIANEVFKIPVGVQDIRKRGAEADSAQMKAAGISTNADLVAGGYEKVDPQSLQQQPMIVPYAPETPMNERQLLPASYYGPKPTMLPVKEGGETQVLPVVKTDEKNRFFDDESKLRKEFEGHLVTKSTTEMMQAGEKALAILDRPGGKFGADDLALIYAFGKLNDPGSAVREGELELAKKSQGYLNQLATIFEGLRDGEVLSGPGRNNLERTIRGILDTQMQLQAKIDEKYGSRADERGFKRAAITEAPWTGRAGTYAEAGPGPAVGGQRKGGLPPDKKKELDQLRALKAKEQSK